MTLVPTCHGFWRGDHVTKAVAWVIDVGVSKPAWIARYKDQCSNPMPLKDAKAAAMAMARGGDGDYVINDPINHLNALAARLVDQAPA